MPRTISCQFQVEKVAKTAWSSEEVVMKAVDDGMAHESKGFANSMRPKGQIIFEVTEPDLFDVFRPGQSYSMELRPNE